MIKSEFVSTIIEVTFEGEKFEDLLLEQIQHLSEKEENYTGSGLFLYFQHNNAIENYRLSRAQLNEICGEGCDHLTKFELINPQLKVLAYVTVHFSKGLVSYVEIWNKLGEYPKEELLSYELQRIKNI